MNDTGFKFDDFPEELQIYILSRLSPKELSRSRCVSKHWNTKLTIQAFMFRHYCSYDKHSKLAFVAKKTYKGYNLILSYKLSDNNSSTNKTMTVPKTTKIRTTLMGTMEVMEVIDGHRERIPVDLLRRNMSNICNDLICLFDCESRHLGLLNIKTRDFIHLPAVTRVGDRYHMKFWFALGFDPVSKVYKVLSIYGGYEKYGTKAAILTVGSKHWKQVEYKFLRCAVTMTGGFWRRNNMFCLDGVIYWVNDYKISQRERVLTVVAFDLNREVFTDYKLDTMPIEDAKAITYYLTSLKGYPTLFIWKKGSNEIQQLTLFKQKNPKVAWNRRSFIANDFLKNFSFDHYDWVAGGSILLKSVVPDNPFLLWYTLYDLENLAIE